MQKITEYQLDEILFQVSRRQIESHLRSIEGDRSPIIKNSKWLEMHEYLQRHLFSLGYFVKMQKFTYLRRDGYNIEAMMTDTESDVSDSRILLVAHYDTVPNSPGADDNASGLAVLLEVARVLAEKLPEASQHVQFVFFDAEEASPELYREHVDDVPEFDSSYSIQGLYGAQAWLKKYLATEKDDWKIKAVLNFESVGYYTKNPNSQQLPAGIPVKVPNKGDFLALITTDTGRSIQELYSSCLDDIRISLKYVNLVVPQKGRTLPDTRRSDHAPFWDHDIPTLFLTDTGNFRNPHYHKPSDRVNTLDIRMIQRITQAAIMFILKMLDLLEWRKKSTEKHF